MSYPAACRAYARACEDLRKLIDALRKVGINVERVMELVERNDHRALLALIEGNEELNSLTKAANHWNGSNENLKEEEAEWNEINRVDSYDNNDRQPMYGGLSDDWKEYLDMIHHDKTYD